jgi:hypothetical protein
MIEINGKKYEFNDDILFGVLEDVQKNPDDSDSMKAMLKEILVPSPSDEDIRSMRMKSQILATIKEFTRYQEEENTDFKKKPLR